MAVRIGHASTGENGGRNNVAGDQTGKEVKISNWYKNNWNLILRPKTSELAEEMARVCEFLCKHPYVGYDMNDRNTLHSLLKSKNYDLNALDKPVGTDCSAFMTLCAIASGVSTLEYTSNAPVCSTMERAFKAIGMFFVIKDKNITNSDKYLQKGDIIVNTSKHTVMALDDGKCFNYVLNGMKGLNVVKVQIRLASKGYQVGEIDGDCGVKTVNAIKAFQKDNGLEVDGIVGKNTWKMIEG